jgi:hypothetical protein
MGAAISISGNSGNSLTGNGVMIFIGPSGSLKISGNGSVTLSPPTSGIYQGMLIFQSRSNSNMLSVTGNGLMSLTGSIYAADATVSATGNGDTVATQIIAYQVQNKGAGQGGAVNVSYNSNNVAKTRQLNLVE